MSSSDEDDLDAPILKQRPSQRQKSPDQTGLLDEWSNDDGEDVGAAAYKKFKAKKPEARKKALASTRKAKAVEAKYRTRELEKHTGVGRQVSTKRKRISRGEDAPSSDEDLMEWKMPDYVQNRRATFDGRVKRLKEGGLHLPPAYEDVYFSEEEGDRLRHIKERPELPNITPSAPYEDIQLPFSAGIIPAPVAQYLRGYQVKGAAFLHELFVYQKGGILGDDMGLGKTIQVIAFLTAAYGKTADERDRKRMRKMRRADKKYPRTLIICPGSLMSNWKDELDRWGWWHADVYHGSVSAKAAVLSSAEGGMLEIMITTYNTYRLNSSAINLIEWDCVVADECHIIKERKSEVTKSMVEINALCRIGLTGTAIQNKYEELWTLLNWTNPGRFGPLSTWKASISEPLKMGQSHNASVYELSRARKTAKKLVENLLPQFFLRRMKTLIKDQLPKKSDRVVFCPLTPTQADAYQNFLDSDMVQLIKNSGNMCTCGSGKKAGWCCNMLLDDESGWQHWVFPAMQTLQKLANHLALLIPQGNDPQDRQAKDLTYLEIAVPDRWKELNRTRDSIQNHSNPDFCGKWRILKKLLHFWQGEGGHKVLVFSHSVRLLRMLQMLLNHTNYNITYLDGSMNYEDRYQTVKNFNSDPTQFVFLISTRAGGVGLNITSANKVVIVDPNWNPSYDLQAQDRAYRIGQTRDVEVFRLVSQGTIEEVVYARQIYKQQQASIAYNATNERRYFQGVQDRKDQKGEIFGLQNLFAFEGENIKLRDIVNKTNIAESKAGIRVANLEVDEDNNDRLGDEHSIKTEPGNEDEAMSQLAAEIVGEFDIPGKKSKVKPPATSFLSETSTTATSKRSDPVQAILAAAGVSYTHENSEVVGSSRVEVQLSKRAEEASENMTRDQQARVFVEESQSQHVYGNGNEDSHTAGDDTIRYRYRPPENVKQRQFCSMAKHFGYDVDADGVIEFALFIENCTQAQRRDYLDKFYAARRVQLELGGSFTAKCKEE